MEKLSKSVAQQISSTFPGDFRKNTGDFHGHLFSIEHSLSLQQK